MYIDFSMSVGELAQIRQAGVSRDDASVQVLLPDGTPYAIPAELDFSGDVVDPATGAVQLRARVANPDGVLLPGTFVTLKATLGTESNVRSEERRVGHKWGRTCSDWW